MSAGQHVASAERAWGDELPPWVLLLAQQCDASSQRRVADRLRFSNGTVSQVINHKYPGRYDAVEGAVKGAFEDATVSCPVLGTLPMQACLEHQRARFANTNPTRVQLFRACRAGCPNSLIKSGAAGKDVS